MKSNEQHGTRTAELLAGAGRWTAGESNYDLAFQRLVIDDIDLHDAAAADKAGLTP